MIKKIAVIVLAFAASFALPRPARAQAQGTSLTPDEQTMLIKGTAEVQQMASLAQDGRPWYKHFSGELDLTNDFGIAAYQSVLSQDEVLGVSKRLFYINRDGKDVLNLGAFGGVDRLDSHGMAGLTAQVPGSDLDWMLGTKMGDAWLPNLKTGMLFGYDLSRPKDLKAQPSFIGVGAAWLFVASQTKAPNAP